MTTPAAEELARRVDEIARTLPAGGLGLGVEATLRGAPSSPAPSQPSSLPLLPLSEASAPSGDARSDLALVTVLGRGGMGVVWQAHQRSLGRDVAIKRVSEEHASAAQVGALLAEARTTGRLEHPGIVPVHALGVDAEGAPLLVMKRIEGASLQALIDDASHPAWPDLLRRHGDRQLAYVEILSRVCDALELAHARGVVHRDIKPENVMVGGFGETYLLDWGVALDLHDAAEATGIVGTPSFMAPEMLEGRAGAIDARTDVYLLGATLHAAVTGAPLHAGATFREVMVKAALSEPPVHGPEVPADLSRIVVDATRRDPHARIPDVRAFRERLAEVRAHRASLALTREVQVRLEPLALRLADGDRRTEVLLASETARTLTEARFGLTHALRDWPDNLDAADTLDRTLGWLAEVELERESPETAAGLLAERRTSDPELAARVELVRARVTERRGLAERAQHDAIEADPRVRGRTRAAFVGALAFVSVGANFLFFETASQSARDDLVVTMATDALQIGLVAAALLAFRRSLLANRWGRRMMALLFVTGALVIAGAAGTWLRGGTEAEQLALRNLVFASVFSVAALDLSPRLWLAATWALSASLASSAWPDLAPALTFVSMALGVLVVVSESIRPSRERRRSQHSSTAT